MSQTSQTGVPSVGVSNASAGTVANQGGTKHRFGILDDCRGVGVIWVFLRHCLNFVPANVLDTLYHPLNFAGGVVTGKIGLYAVFTFLFFLPVYVGWVALAGFFVVSGFCIHLTYFQPSRPDLKGFYIRRFFRIYPPYLLAVLFFALVFPVSKLPLNKLTYWGQLITHLFLVHNVSELSAWAITGAYWTIAVECQLYLMFPLLLVYVRRHSYARALVWLALIEVSLHTISAVFFDRGDGFSPAWLGASPFFFCFSWTIGAALADAYLSGRPLPFTRIHPVVWLIPLTVTYNWKAHEFGFTFAALFGASVIARHLRSGSEAEPRSYLARFIRQAGIYSYSIYLIHEPILRALVPAFEARFPGIQNNPYLIFGAGASTWLLIFPLGALMYYCVEKPSIYFGKRLLRAWNRRLAPQPVASVAPAA